MVDYVGLQATAARLIKANGVPVTLLKQGAAIDYDPASATVEVGGQTSFTGYALREGSEVILQYQVREAADSRKQVETQGIMLTLDNASARVAIGDQIQMDAQIWRIYAYTPVSPGPVTLYYKAGLTLI